MGLSFSVVLANAFMEELEEKLLASSPLKPAMWRRYVDDTWVLWQHGDDALAEFLERMNGIHEDIKFTMETERDGKLPFLDVLVTRNGSDGLDTEVYRKAIASNVYIPASSNHAHSIKRGIIKNMFDRARNVCSTSSSRRKEERTLQDIFCRNGYKNDFIQKSSKNRSSSRTTGPASGETSVSNEPTDSEVSQSTEADQQPGAGPSSVAPPSPGSSQPCTSRPSSSNRPRYVSMPYVKGVSEPVSRFLRAHNVIVGHSSKTLRKSLVRVKDRPPKGKQKGTVYEVQCDCGQVYIGESGRPKDVRLNEHAKDIQHGRVQKSAPARHARECDREIHPMEAKTLACESNWRKRTVREAIEIKEKDPYMNRDIGKFALSPIWDFTLRNAA